MEDENIPNTRSLTFRVIPMPTPLHYHEAFDRSKLVQDMIGNMLMKHPVVLTDQELRDKVATAYKLIGEVYQKLKPVDSKLK